MNEDSLVINIVKSKLKNEGEGSETREGGTSNLQTPQDADVLNITSGFEYAEKYVEAEKNQHHQESIRSATGISTTANNLASKDIDRLVETYRLGAHSEENLTISGMKDEIVSLIEKSSVVIIRGPTGCGKTTRVPQYILDKCFETKVGCNIIVTQPRRIAATSIAKRVCDERNWPLPSIVGYQIGQDTCTADDTRLIYCTTGVLLNQIVKQKNLNAFTHIIIDEVHERDQDTDFLLLIVRRMLRSNSCSVKVILMSATINVNKFSRYFSFYSDNNLRDAPVFDVVKMNTFRVDEFYLDDISVTGEAPKIRADRPCIAPEMFVRCQKIISSLNPVNQILSTLGGADTHLPTVLVFLPGIWEIGEMHRILDETNDQSLEITVLHSSSSSEERKKIFAKPIPGKRQIILATNIAESSLTVPNVKYVIDFCLSKLLVTDPDTNFQYLQMTWASKANCQQRAGRTGRVMDGFVYRLVSRIFYEQVLPEETSPEMLRAPLTSMILKAKIVDIDKPEGLLALALDPPNIVNITASILLLKEVGALITIRNDSRDGELTDLGRVMAELPIDIRISKMIVLGYVFSVLSDAIIMGACMATKCMFNTPYKKKFPAYKAKLKCAKNTASDVIAMKNIYECWKVKKAKWKQNKSKGAEKEWARNNFVDLKVFKEIEAVIGELESRLWRSGIRENLNVNNVVWTDEQRLLVLKSVIAGAFYPQYFSTKPLYEIKNDENLNFPDPAKTVFLTGWPLTQPGMLYAKHVRDILTDCLSSQGEKISIKFGTSNRVFIQFNGNGSRHTLGNQTIGSISNSVYLAIKMGKTGKALKIPVMNEPKSKEFAEKMIPQINQQNFMNTFINPPNEKDCLASVELKGPYSPLQTELKILTNAGTDMTVLIDDFSVNSVLLDLRVKNHESRLLVATHVSTRRATKNRKAQLTVWNTTLLPTIPGLPSLLALIFAPHAELRCDPEKTRNTGALCGLGYDPDNKFSLCPKRDMSLIFDVEITNEDLESINNLRHSMSMMISVALCGRRKREEATEWISEHQKNVQHKFLEIIEKKRREVPRYADSRGKQWCRYEPSMFVDQDEDSNNHVFRHHPILALKEKDTAREMMVLHLMKIRKQAEGSDINENNETIQCKLCSIRFSGISELRTHLFSSYHFTREFAFLSCAK